MDMKTNTYSTKQDGTGWLVLRNGQPVDRFEGLNARKYAEDRAASKARQDAADARWMSR